jgi:hypothetical protein
MGVMAKFDNKINPRTVPLADLAMIMTISKKFKKLV